MQKLITDIKFFISQNTSLVIVENPVDFPETPFSYLFFPEKSMAIHCVPFQNILQEATFFQRIGLSLAQKNIHLIHLWEDVWQTKRGIVESRLMAILGKSKTIPARLTQAQRIDKPTIDKFLIDNHLQGKANAKLKYGLWLPKHYFRVLSQEKDWQQNPDEEALLVAVALFSNPKKIVRNGQEFRSFELIRFANHRGFTVVGGINKLLKIFINQHAPDDIMTYADADWSNGKNYEKIGFKRGKLTTPLAFELDKNLERKLSNNQLQVTEEFQKMRCFNSGNWKFLMELK